jgi:hypothetical protein
MTSLERAKQFLQSKGRTLALTVVPLASLAALAAPAKAGLILNTTSCGVNVSGGTGSGTCTVTQFPSGSNGVTGVSLTGSGTTTAGPSGGFLELTFLANGTTNSGSFLGVLPMAYDFILSDSSGGLMGWSLNINGSGGAFVSAFASGSSTGGEIKGTLNPTVSGSCCLTNYSIELDVNEVSAPPGGSLTVTIPGSSIDINPVSAAVPEPATFGLIGTALAAFGSLAFWRRKKR